jgi:hypothetical protein
LGRKIRPLYIFFLLAAVILVLFIVQYFVIEYYTVFYIDEDVYARLAYSILHGHLASASSFYQIYAQFGYNRTDIYTPFGSSTTVEPWLDHPPLVPILSGSFFLIGGVSPRVLPIIFCILIALEIFVLLRHQLILAWISVIVWVAYVSTSPLLSMLFLEAGVSFFLMSTLVLVKEFDSRGSRVYLYAAAITAGLCGLSKIFGISAILFLLLFLIYYARRKPARKQLSVLAGVGAVSLSVVITLTWFVYGFLAAPNLFQKLFTLNAQRSLLSAHNIDLLVLVKSPVVGPSQISGGSFSLPLVIGIVCLLYLFFRKDTRLLQLCIVSYLGFSFALGYFWFYTTIPLYPFYSIGVGYLIYAVIFRGRKHDQGPHGMSTNTMWESPSNRTLIMLSKLPWGASKCTRKSTRHLVLQGPSSA